MDENVKLAFTQYLMQVSGAKDSGELEKFIQDLGEDGVKQAFQQFMQAMQLQQVQAAKFGAKLNYISKLRGECPEGQEMQYFKAGGRVCKKCMKIKAKEGAQMPKNAVDAFKCGRKMKKAAVKKEACGSKIDVAACGKKLKEMACGSKLKKKKC